MQIDSAITAAVEAINAQIAASMEAVWNGAYAQGKADAKAELLALLQGGLSADLSHALPQPSGETPERPTPDVVAIESQHQQIDNERPGGRKRAPKGLPRKLVTRALGEASSGLTPQQILDSSKTDYEKMIKVTTIRSELRNGKSDGIYEEDRGLWFLKRSQDNVN